MHKQFTALAAAALLAAAAACENGPTESGPGSIVPNAGNGQVALVGQRLPVALQVAVRDGGSQAMEGQWVHWSVAQGSGQLSADSSRTDVTGLASVQLTLGNQPGEVRVTATVGRLAPAQFTATAQSHCQAGVVRQLRVAGGGGQAALTHDSVQTRLQVQALCDEATPLANVAVAWQVTAGGATLYSTTSTTDAAGSAFTGVAMGDTPGSVTVRASAAGVDPAVFALTARDRCDVRTDLASGQALQATLRRVDCAREPGIWGDSRYIVYRLQVDQPELVKLRMQITSNGLDPVVELWNTAETRLLATGQGWMHVRLDPGTYHLRTATRASANGTGFTVSRTAPLAQEECSDVFPGLATPVWLLPGTTVQGAIATTDCGRSLDQPRWYDEYYVQLNAGESVTATLRTANGFAPLMSFGSVVQEGFSTSWTLVSSHRSDGTPLTATLTAPRTGIYAIQLHGGNNGLGTYSIELQ